MYDFTDRSRWTPIPQAPKYVCNRHGVVYNSESKKEMATNYRNNGHPAVSLRLPDGREVRRQVNHLIAELFLPDYDPKCEIFFHNGDKTDINVDNLYQTERGRRGIRRRED